MQIENFQHCGATLVAEVSGEACRGELVLLHGWGGTRESLRGIGALFQNAYRIHLLDLPGFGQAPPPPSDWSTVQYANLVQRYVQDRVSAQVIVVGHSFGGRIAIRLAARDQAELRGIVLMGVPGLPQPMFSRRRIRQLSIRFLRGVLRTLEPLTGSGLIDWYKATFGSKDYLAAGPLRSVLVRVVNEDLTASAKLITCPTLLLWGTDDTETPLWLARRYKELIKGGATMVLLPHKDHHLCAGTGAHLCGLKIREWLQAIQNV